MKKFRFFLSYFFNRENMLQHNKTQDEIRVITHLLSKKYFNITASQSIIHIFQPVVCRKSKQLKIHSNIFIVFFSKI